MMIARYLLLGEYISKKCELQGKMQIRMRTCYKITMGFLILLFSAIIVIAGGNIYVNAGLILLLVATGGLAESITAVFMWRIRRGVQRKFSRVPGMLSLKPIQKVGQAWRMPGFLM